LLCDAVTGDSYLEMCEVVLPEIKNQDGINLIWQQAELCPTMPAV
jgi:hypothetical protein